MKPFLLFLSMSILCFNVQAQIRLPKLISNGMVLQRHRPLHIWGWASPGETVQVAFNNKQYKTTTATDGKWQLQLPAMKAGGPYTMQLTASNRITIKDILIGDVWLCSGQSNMELEMVRLKYKYAKEIAEANNPFIRQFLVPDVYDFNQQHTDLDKGEWLAATPKNVLQFSGVAYFFAKALYSKHKIPIGLINASLGGSPAEAWISEDAVKAFPEYYQELQAFKSKTYIDSIETNQQKAIGQWYQQLNAKDTGLQQNWKHTNNTQNWQSMQVPGYWANTPTGQVNGVVWFRKTFQTPAAMAGKAAKVELGRIVDADSVFINGVYVGNTTYQYPPRRYEFAEGILKAGDNTIVVRVVNNGGRGGFVLDKRYELTTATDTVNLSGTWQYKVGAVMPPTPSQTFIRWKPVGLYNAMVAPLTRYPIKGVIWYQGEANTKKPGEYTALMKTLITSWRNTWQQQFPFLFVQLANFMEARPQPTESSWAATRQAQFNTLKVPNTGMAVITDIGDWNDIHPENKKDVGHRLSLLARKLAYKENITASGPLYQSMQVQGNKVVLHFSNVGKGLVCKGDTLQQFAIAGADKKFVWARAILKNNTVVVWNDAVTQPVVVRYAWADNPQGANLYNKEGLPASPFTTEKEL
jgi:sialate O-acetylesterase